MSARPTAGPTADGPPAVILARGLQLRRGGRRLLDGVDLTAPAGRTLALVGPNGAGKSTLLGALSGLVRPDAGVLHFGGRPLQAWDPAALARQRAALGQAHPAGLPHSAAQVVALGRAPWGGRCPGGQPAAAFARGALAAVGLADRADQPVATLSGGEAQRVHLARVLAQLAGAEGPRLLLLDEPTSQQDPAWQLRVLALCRAAADAGAAVVAVLHDLHLAARWADAVLLLRAGRPVAFGPPAEALAPGPAGRAFDLRFHTLGDPARPLLVPEPPADHP